MGYDTISWSVSGRVSRHNSPRDTRDNDLWDKLTKELVAVCDKPEYDEIISFSCGHSPFEHEHRWD